MKRFIYTFAFIFLSITIVKADNTIGDLTQYINEGIDATIVEIGQYGEITIKLENGDYINTSVGTNVEIWGDEKATRNILLFYTTTKGVYLKDIGSKKIISLPRSIDPHPIDIAVARCGNETPIPIGYEHCAKLEYLAWDKEMNRAFKELGGNRNKELLTAQLAWIKFRDAQLEYYKSLYFPQQGSKWGRIYLNAKTDITRKQAILLMTLPYAVGIYNNRISMSGKQ